MVWDEGEHPNILHFCWKYRDVGGQDVWLGAEAASGLVACMRAMGFSWYLVTWCIFTLAFSGIVAPHVRVSLSWADVFYGEGNRRAAASPALCMSSSYRSCFTWLRHRDS